MARQTIWSTEKVHETLDKYKLGLDVDLSFFHERDITLRGSGVLFQPTQEEKDEFAKCSEDVVYFVSKYCKFMTDGGLSTVKLHDYQEEILETVGEEEWIDEIEEFGPKVRNFILMAARQIGKCFFRKTLLKITNKKTKEILNISIGDLYNIANQSNLKSFKEKILIKIKTFLYNIHNKLG